MTDLETKLGFAIDHTAFWKLIQELLYSGDARNERIASLIQMRFAMVFGYVNATYSDIAETLGYSSAQTARQATERALDTILHPHYVRRYRR